MLLMYTVYSGLVLRDALYMGQVPAWTLCQGTGEPDSFTNMRASPDIESTIPQQLCLD